MTFDYHEPASVEEAVTLLLEHGDDAVAMAGGTVVALELKSGRSRPGHVVGLRRVGGLTSIVADSGTLWLGSMATHRELESAPEVRNHHPAIASGFASIGSVRIRNQGTLGGSLAAAVSAHDPPPVLMVFDAGVHIAGPKGSIREVPLDDFFVGDRRSILQRAELIVGVRVPAVMAGTRATYLRFTPGSSEDSPTVSVAASLHLDSDGRIAAVRIALGAVAAIPVRARAVEAALLGRHPDSTLLGEAAALVRDEIEPIGDRHGSTGYKREMARVWVGRALADVVGVAA